MIGYTGPSLTGDRNALGLPQRNAVNQNSINGHPIPRSSRRWKRPSNTPPQNWPLLPLLSPLPLCYRSTSSVRSCCFEVSTQLAAKTTF